VFIADAGKCVKPSIGYNLSFFTVFFTIFESGNQERRKEEGEEENAGIQESRKRLGYGL